MASLPCRASLAAEATSWFGDDLPWHGLVCVGGAVERGSGRRAVPAADELALLPSVERAAEDVGDIAEDGDQRGHDAARTEDNRIAHDRGGLFRREAGQAGQPRGR